MNGGAIQPKAKVREQSIRAIVRRADGRVEDLGLISYYHQNPILRAVGKMRVKLNEFVKRR